MITVFDYQYRFLVIYVYLRLSYTIYYYRMNDSKGITSDTFPFRTLEIY